MSYEANLKAEEDGGKRRSNRSMIIALLTTLILSGLAYCGFHNINGVSYNGIMRDVSLQDGNKINTSNITIRLNDALDEIRDLRRELQKTSEQLVQVQEKNMKLLSEFQSNTRTNVGAQCDEDRRGALEALNQSIESDPFHHWMLDRRHSLPAEFREYVAPRKLPLGFSPAYRSDTIAASVGQACVANIEDIKNFMSYEVGKVCPDDGNLAQKLLLAGCEPLPRRRCLARGPKNASEPVPYPDCLWTAPEDGNINWEAFDCKSFECLNTRAARGISADCLDCFDLGGREPHRWIGRPSVSPSVDYTVDQVLALKKGGIRIGLDIGGGGGSFAVRMRENNVTIITSTLNLGAPFNNFIAQRGVIPFFMTIEQRFPFWDNTLDIVHSMHVLSNWIPDDIMEFIFYDIDRVLRPGGILWLDHFFCVQSELDTKYAPLIRSLGYKELRWDLGKKLDRGADKQEVYLSALLEKPISARY